MAQPTRCGWAGPEPIYLDYHDHEWGRPTHDDRALFELLSLEGMQAGLSWITILKKREAFRAAFADFEPAAVARFDEAKVAELMQNAGIVRNRRKIVSVIENARHFLEVQREFGSFDRFLWAYVDGKPIVKRVIATGGGVVESAENRRLLRESGVVVLLDRDIRQIAGCVGNRERPLLKQYTLEQLARRRRDWYLDCADAAISSGTVEQLAAQAAEIWRNA